MGGKNTRVCGRPICYIPAPVARPICYKDYIFRLNKGAAVYLTAWFIRHHNAYRQATTRTGDDVLSISGMFESKYKTVFQEITYESDASKTSAISFRHLCVKIMSSNHTDGDWQQTWISYCLYKMKRSAQKNDVSFDAFVVCYPKLNRLNLHILLTRPFKVIYPNPQPPPPALFGSCLWT